MRRLPFATLLTGLLAVGVLLAYPFTFQVRFSESAVRVRWGKVVGVVDQPGLYLRWPWPIESIEEYDTRLRTLDTMESEVKTKDGKNVIVGNYAVWRIAEPVTFMKSVGTARLAEEKLRARINQRRAAVIGNRVLADFVSLNEEEVNKSLDGILDDILTGRQIEGEQGISLKEGVSKDFGVELVNVNIRRISLPEETTQTVFQSMIAERQAVAAELQTQGKSRAQTITSQAEASRQAILNFASAKAEEIRAVGVQASRAILEQIEQQDAQFFEWLRWLEALRLALQQRSTIFIDSDSTLFEYFQPPTTSDLPATTQPAGGVQ